LIASSARNGSTREYGASVVPPGVLPSGADAGALAESLAPAAASVHCAAAATSATDKRLYAALM